MKTTLVWLAMLLASQCFGANPSFTDFNTNQFNVTGNKVAVKNGARETNITLVGTNTVADGGKLVVSNIVFAGPFVGVNQTPGLYWGQYSSPYGETAVFTIDATHGWGMTKSGSLLPVMNASHDIGTNLLQWKDLWISGTIYTSGVPLVTGSGSSITFSNQLWVDKAGSDSTGARNDPALPFLTIPAAMSNAISGDVVNVGAGRFTNQVIMSNSVSLRGIDWDRTVIVGTNSLVAAGGGCVVALANNCELANLEVVASYTNNIAGPIGTDENNGQGAFQNATVRNVKTSGLSDGLFVRESTFGCSARFISCVFTSAWDCVAFDSPAGTPLIPHNLEFIDCQLISTGPPTLANAFGESRAVNAVVGGAKLFNCYISVTNGTTNTIGIQARSSTATIDLFSTSILTGSTNGGVYDIVATNGSTVRWYGANGNTNKCLGTVTQVPLSFNSPTFTGTITNKNTTNIMDGSLLLGGTYSNTAFFDFNVKSFGAKGDTRKVIDAVLTSGSTNVRSVTANFTTNDIGKVIFGVETASGLLRLPRGTITSIGSTTNVGVSTTAAGTYSGIYLVFGTDDADAIRACGAAADAAYPKGTVRIPGGGYLFSKQLFSLSYASGTDTISIQGDGRASTILYPDPNYNFAATAGGIVLTETNAAHLRLGGFTVDGYYYGFPSNTSFLATLRLRSQSSVIHDVYVSQVLNTVAGFEVIGNECSFYDCQVQGGYRGIYINGSTPKFYNCYAGNCSIYSVWLQNSLGTNNTSGGVRWFGGTIDESTSGALVVENSTDVNLFGVTMFGPPSSFAASVDGFSVVDFSGCSIVDFGKSGNRSGLKVATNGVAYLAQCRLSGTGTGVAITNAGTIYDCGGNWISIGSITGNKLLPPPTLYSIGQNAAVGNGVPVGTNSNRGGTLNFTLTHTGSATGMADILVCVTNGSFSFTNQYNPVSGIGGTVTNTWSMPIGPTNTFGFITNVSGTGASASVLGYTIIGQP